MKVAALVSEKKARCGLGCQGSGGVLGARGMSRMTRGLGFPGSAEDFALFEYESFSIAEVGVHFGALNGVARSTASDQVAGVFFPFAGARMDKIDAHDESIFETGAAVEAAVLAAIVIAFENLQAFVHGYRGSHQGKGCKA